MAERKTTNVEELGGVGVTYKLLLLPALVWVRKRSEKVLDKASLIDELMNWDIERNPNWTPEYIKQIRTIYSKKTAAELKKIHLDNMSKIMQKK